MGKTKKYIASFLFVAALAAWHLFSGGFTEAQGREKWRLLCDALAIPGVLLLCAGLWVFCCRQGALDGLGYGLRRLRFGKNRPESFSDYAARKHAGRCGGYGCFFIAGGISTALSLLAMGIYYRLS